MPGRWRHLLLYLIKRLLPNVPSHRVENISLGILADGIAHGIKIRRPPVQIYLAVRGWFHEVFRVVTEVEQAAKAGGFAAGDVPVSVREMQFVLVEVLKHLDLGMDAWQEVEVGVVVEEAAGQLIFYVHVR